MINIPKGDGEITVKAIRTALHAGLVGYLLSGASSYAQNTDAELSLNAIGSDFWLALAMFFVITISLVFWLLVNRHKDQKRLDEAIKHETFLRHIVMDKNQSFYLWNDQKELTLKSPINIRFEDDSSPDGLDDLKSRFSKSDLDLFESNLNKLLKIGSDFTQTIDLKQFNMHLLITGNALDIDEFGKKFYVVWFKDNTIAEKIQRYQMLENNDTSDRVKMLENALNVANFPVWIRGEDLKLKWVNKAYLDAVGGITFKNVIEKNLELSTNTLGVSLKSMAEGVSLSGEQKSESHYIVIGGERRSMDFHNIPYAVEDHSEAILGYAQDITELEEARGSLADHTESYAETLDKFSTAVAIFDRDMRLEYYNKAYIRLWGLPESLLFSHPDYGEILEALREARKLPEQANFPAWKKKQLEDYTQVIDPVEKMMHLPDGKTLRVVMQHHPMGGMLIFYEDVTDYFALESSYNTLIAVQRETLDNLHEGIAVFGFDGRLKLFNDGFINIWDVSNDFLNTDPHAYEVMDRCGRLFDSFEEIEQFKTMIVGGEVKKEANSGQIKLNNDKVINYSMVPLPDGAVLLIFIDVTDSFRVEYSLRKHNEALEEAQNIKTDFLAHMSYELRNPLNSVLGFAELLEKEYQGPLNDQQHQYMKNILSASDHLLDLINDILDISVIEAGGLSIDTSDFDLSELIDGVVNKLDERIKQKSINLTVEYDPDLKTVTADPRRIQHSISNLLSNAVKFTPDSGSIDIKTWQDSQNYFITIRDDGIGIEPDDIQNIFEKFYTGSNTPKGKGTGLGLSLVKIFVEKHGGEVIVESDLGFGTEMTCKLPKELPDLEEIPDQDVKADHVQIPL
ncbi:sensor histidine kinase [Pseudemcibacter aquimaris]|uniref:sensor histidine kinase n=1 Tax=Pseudemcibacter aquimaris TaxID=2857064 RepID=UPI0020132D70|nr:ATP-binding protein [Pseudemcibacter aquimaris]MCC3860272.1 PAS-domain containing protein [Pseudemcibacter aquimaris]WDU57597.1 PAS-domain containing protein [Pseudemcibacter aquimaris]